MALKLPQSSIAPRTDLREMLRRHIISRSLACMEKAAERRNAATASSVTLAEYRKQIRSALWGFYGSLPADKNAPPPQAKKVSTFTHEGFRIENVLFDSFPGWEVNASVYVPTDFAPPFPTVVVAVGHSGKQFESYQLPCQYFARSGFLTIVFDPPGQASEKIPGNDHFNDGVRDYLIGETSSRYFIADALRCIDYLETRDDVDLANGVAMTGVSGGGTTTTFAQLLDERISVIGPSCCVTALSDLDISQCYAGCPETHQFRRYAEGIDEVDLLCAGAPLPCMLMAGRDDSVFRIADVKKLAATVEDFYAASDADEAFEFFVDAGGHAYSLEQARQFSNFMNRWLCKKDGALPELPDSLFAMRPREELNCSPRLDVNMRTLAIAQADALAQKRDTSSKAIRAGAMKVAGVTNAIPVPEEEIAKPFQVFGTHDWQSVMLRPETGIELPGTFLTARDQELSATILCIDEGGRHRFLHRHGKMARAIRFIEQEREKLNLFTVDLRGWGDTSPAMYPYELAGWGSIDRYLAYSTAALGDPVLSMRIRDALSSLAWLRQQPTVDETRILLYGYGLGGIVALHAAMIDGNVAGVVTENSLFSFRSLIETESYPWTADAFLPNALRYYDLPELANALACPVRLFGLKDGSGKPAEETELDRYNIGSSVRASTKANSEEIANTFAKLLIPTRQ